MYSNPSRPSRNHSISLWAYFLVSIDNGSWMDVDERRLRQIDGNFSAEGKVATMAVKFDVLSVSQVQVGWDIPLLPLHSAYCLKNGFQTYS